MTYLLYYFLLYQYAIIFVSVSIIIWCDAFVHISLLWLATGLICGVGVAALLVVGVGSSLAMVLVCSMAVLNTAQRLDSRLGPPFTVMTGNVTSVAIEVARRLGLTPCDPGLATGTTAVTMLVLVVGFAAGCALGAVSQIWTGLAAMILPATLLAGHLLLR